MPHTARAVRFAAIVFVLALVTAPAAAAQPAARPAGPPQGLPAAAVPVGPADDFDAERVREQFYEVLQKYPPSLGACLQARPVAHDQRGLSRAVRGRRVVPGAASGDQPQSCLLPRARQRAGATATSWTRPRRSGGRSRRCSRHSRRFSSSWSSPAWSSGSSARLIDARRWNRVSRTQAEVHTKLLDRFSSNEDLLAYIQTPVGRRFLESGPAPLPEDARPIGAPFSRILLSVQTGIVLTVAAAGMLYLSRRMDEEVSAFFLVTGVVSLAVGVGFLVSGAAAFAISSRLGPAEPRRFRACVT